MKDLFLGNLQVGNIKVEVTKSEGEEDQYIIYEIILDDGQSLSLYNSEFDDLRVIANMLNTEDFIQMLNKLENKSQEV